MAQERLAIQHFLEHDKARPVVPHTTNPMLNYAIQAFSTSPLMVSALVRRMRMRKLRAEHPDILVRYTHAFIEVAQENADAWRLHDKKLIATLSKSRTLRRAVMELLR